MQGEAGQGDGAVNGRRDPQEPQVARGVGQAHGRPLGQRVERQEQRAQDEVRTRREDVEEPR